MSFIKVASGGKDTKPLGRLGETNRSLPWRIILKVRPSLLAVELKPVVYYIRGSNPQAACMMASKLWTKWEKYDIGLGEQEYPDVEDFGEAMCIDEQDFRNAYKEAKKYKLKMRAAGDLKDPSAFTCLGVTSI